MFARVQSDELKRVLGQLIFGRKSDNVSFKAIDGALYVQTNTLFIHNMYLDTAELNTADGITTITVTVDNSINLIKDGEIVTLEINADSLSMRCKSFSTYLKACFSEYYDCATKQFGEMKKVSLDALSDIVESSKALDDIAKLLGAPLAPVYIIGGKYYIYYSNTAVVGTAPDLVDCTLSAELLRKVQAPLKRSFGSTEVLYDSKNLLKFNISGEEEVIVAYGNLNLKIVEGLVSLCAKSEEVMHVNFAPYVKDIQTIGRVYPKALVTLSFYSKGIGINLATSTTLLDIGEIGKPILSIKISTAQLLVLGKFYGGEVTVKRGESGICLDNKRTTTILSGMIF